jgi:hypothetical protein
MIRVVATGPHTRLESELCSACPQGVTGCCAAPPVIAWADLGRIVTLGGAQWLLDELASARLYPCARGLAIHRVDNPDAATTGRERKCVYHGEHGCTVAHDRRSATCNYYVCDDALAGSSPALRDKLTRTYAEWDLVLAARVRAKYPHGPEWTLDMLMWLGEETAHLLKGSDGNRRRRAAQG